jgi:polysaccharide export outer membrane protein
MASGHPGDAVRQINRLFRDGTNASLTDGQLLERFTTRRAEVAEAAFEALVSRHGPMVLRVCRGVLRDPHDVEDAFQATFLVLVRKGHSLGERELLGPWLYGVAHRVSLKARGVAARRNRREGRIVDDPPADVAEGPWLDLRPMLHEELNRLPEKYRKPVVLCHLQGLTHSEAAQELAWPVGTVSVRLTRARKLLKERLTRRGLTVTATLWAAGLTLEGASAAVPESLIRSTTMAALQASTAKILASGTISAGAISLTKRTLTMMMMSRLKWLVIPLALGLGAAAGVVGMRMISPKPVEDEVDRVSVELGPVPPNFFDVARLATKDESGPPVVQVGQILIVEVLEALPGRPITGERIVRPDGTISMGFYGDLPVAGLNRNQIKVKLLEHLRAYISDETLGLVVFNANGKHKVNTPMETSRVFVDESINYMKPVAKGGQNAPEALSDRIDELNAKLARVLKELEQSRQGQRPAEAAPDPARPAASSSAPAPKGSTPG